AYLTSVYFSHGMLDTGNPRLAWYPAKYVEATMPVVALSGHGAAEALTASKAASDNLAKDMIERSRKKT
ncbi:hypothetical protein CH063_05070, partial [Colletotrichum higginsianum]